MDDEITFTRGTWTASNEAGHWEFWWSEREPSVDLGGPQDVNDLIAVLQDVKQAMERATPPEDGKR